MSAVESNIEIPRRRVPPVAAPKREHAFVPPFAAPPLIENIDYAEVRKRTREFLHQTLPECLGEMGTTDDKVDLTVENTELTEVCGMRYAINLAGGFCKLWVGVNVKRLIIVIFYPQDYLMPGGSAPPDGVPHLASERAFIPESLQYAVAGAEHVGFDVHNEPAIVDGKKVMSLWMTNWLSPYFLHSKEEQTFVGQDLALFVQSLLRAAGRKKMRLYVDGVDPSPL
jgi:hypothetical protein